MARDWLGVWGASVILFFQWALKLRGDKDLGETSVFPVVLPKHQQFPHPATQRTECKGFLHPQDSTFAFAIWHAKPLRFIMEDHLVFF